MKHISLPVDQRTVAVDKDGRILAAFPLSLFNRCTAGGEAVGLPDIVLITKGDVRCVGLSEQAPEIALRTEVAAVMRSPYEAAVLSGDIPQKLHGAVLRAVVLHEHAEGGIILRSEGRKLLREMLFALIACKEHGDGLHHFSPHFAKYWMVERR